MAQNTKKMHILRKSQSSVFLKRAMYSFRDMSKLINDKQIIKSRIDK